jgi:hypothetical protein
VELLNRKFQISQFLAELRSLGHCAGTMNLTSDAPICRQRAAGVLLRSIRVPIFVGG